MITFVSLITIFWIIFIVYWFISALGAKKSVRTGGWWRGIWFRVGFIIVFLLIIHIPVVADIGRYYYASSAASNRALDVLGVVICGAGVAFAIWARVYLGRNWGMPMTLQENHELVTSGPYKLVRHPIYTGVLAAMLGSTFILGIAYLFIPIVAGIYFIYSAKVEEGIMAKQFPNEYPGYMKKTKMIIPWIL